MTCHVMLCEWCGGCISWSANLRVASAPSVGSRQGCQKWVKNWKSAALLCCRDKNAITCEIFGVGEKYWGGLAQKARVNGDWLVHMPKEFTPKQAMAIGTAGYTSMLCVMALENNGITPDKGEILVTGATGGVGSVAISLLSKLGYNICASSGREEHSEYLKSLGASNIINRNELSEKGRPLNKERWAGAIDSVGSHTLANICASLKYGGTVAACGLAQGYDLPSTVMPFILRGITLAGVDSVYCPLKDRITAWDRLASDLNIDQLNDMISTIPLSEVVDTTHNMLAGKTHGRIIVDVNS